MGTVTAFSGFFSGAIYPLRAWRFLAANRGLYRYIAVPLLINIVVFGAGGYWGISLTYDFIAGFLPESQAWYWAWLSYLLKAAVLLAALIVTFFSFAVLGTIIAAPFNDLLSERTEEALTGRGIPGPLGLHGHLVQALRAVRVEGGKLLVFLGGLTVLFVINIIVPVLGTALALLMTIAWTILFLAAEYAGYVFARRGLTFGEQWRLVRRNFAVLAGFGTGLFCILAVPFVQFFCIPLGVVGATMLVHDYGMCASAGHAEGKENRRAKEPGGKVT